MAKIQSASVPGKETIYVDVDDEITAIIDKVRAAKGKVIALVLPKRATVLQSIVNMKLLKRTADDADKNLVLVTSEAGLMPLAGSVGLHVAETPTSKPYVPPAPEGPSDEPENIDEPLNIVDNTADEEDFDAKAAGATAVGELAGGAAAGKIAADDIDESIDMDEEADADTPAEAAEKPKKNKKLAVPNFDSFRKKLMLAAGVLVLLIIAWIFAFVVLPKASIAISTDSSTITTNLNLSLDTSAKQLDTDNNVVPAVSQTQQKTSTQTVPSTGQQNNGQKATGSVTFTLTDCKNSTVDIPTGSGVSSGGQTYITQSEVVLNSVTVGGHCNPSAFSNLYSGSVKVVALKGGTSYNTSSGATFTVPSSISGASSVAGKASTDIDGGTDDITKVVSQSDIDNATSKIKAQDSDSVKQQLTSSLQSKGLEAVPSTMISNDPQVTTSAKAGDKADNVTVTAVTTYTMLGVSKSDLKTLVLKNVNSQIDKGKQVVLDDGIANATFTEQSTATATSAGVSMQVKSLAGPDLNVANIKKQVAGKKSGDVKSLLTQIPGVTDVKVKYSPFWVSSVPKKASKITIQIDKSGPQ